MSENERFVLWMSWNERSKLLNISSVKWKITSAKWRVNNLLVNTEMKIESHTVNDREGEMMNENE